MLPYEYSKYSAPRGVAWAKDPRTSKASAAATRNYFRDLPSILAPVQPARHLDSQYPQGVHDSLSLRTEQPEVPEKQSCRDRREH